ncbi:UDP binding domain-containing protein, partial [Planktothrix sp.]|uniref:UDP binding domain-containing protein n=1 Tax=Planktothrix sp. TaxID=3088171 RepID=UPI0038D46E21
ADIDDLRESPALKVVEKLLAENLGYIFVVEPHLRTLPLCLKNQENLAIVNLDQAVNQCDIFVLLVSHREFSTLNLNLIKEKILLDMVENS